LALPSAPLSLQKTPDVMAAWPRSAQWAMIFLLGAATALLVGQALKSLRWGTRPSDLEPGAGPGYRIDLNRADRAELMQLPGVGDKLAQKILDHRQKQGGFRHVDDLLNVPGVGEATLAALRPWVCVEREEEDEDEPPPADRRPARPPKKRKSPPGKQAPNQKLVSKKVADLKEKINVNQADAEELRRLPRIGKELANRIIEERRKGPFKSVEDLKRVSGIGAKTMELLRPHVTFDGRPGRGGK
jgi:competence protein ComEA